MGKYFSEVFNYDSDFLRVVKGSNFNLEDFLALSSLLLKGKFLFFKEN